MHWYLEELGQGIQVRAPDAHRHPPLLAPPLPGVSAPLSYARQHVASRVASLPEYVQRANDYRAITGEGVAFLEP